MNKVKNIVAASATIMILFSLIAVPSYADTNVTVDDWEPYEIPQGIVNDQNPTASYDSGVNVLNANIGGTDYTFNASADQLSYYFVINDQGSSKLYIASENEFSFGVWRLKVGTAGASRISSGRYTNTNNEYGLKYVLAHSRAGYIFNGPQFSTVNEGLASLRNYLDNPPSPLPDPGYFSLNLNPGYVAFIDITDLTGVNVSLDTTLFGGADWNNHQTDQNIGLLNSMPASFRLPISGTSHINWSGTGSKNILGQYKSFKANYTYSTVGNTTYLVIVNPLQARMDAQMTAMASMPSQRNNPIFISVSQARTCKIYSLTASLSVGSGNLDIESNGDIYSGTIDGDGNWTYINDDTGTTIDPDTLPIGGGNDPIIGQETSINDWLQNIANQIKGFFSGAIGAVTTLVNAGSAFINSLIGLYSWLPAPVYSVLSAALIIVITVGVIKVFI